MSIWSSINCPTVICSPTVCYFSREKPLVKPTAPGSVSHIFAFAIYFLFAFIFRSTKPKTQKHFAVIYSYLFYLAFDLSIYYNLFTSVCQFMASLPERDFNTSGCEWLLFVWRGCLHCVAWFSYWFDTLVSLLRKYLPLMCYIIPSPLGKHRRSPSRQELSGSIVREQSSYEPDLPKLQKPLRVKSNPLTRGLSCDPVQA